MNKLYITLASGLLVGAGALTPTTTNAFPIDLILSEDLLPEDMSFQIGSDDDGIVVKLEKSDDAEGMRVVVEKLTKDEEEVK